MLSPSELVAAKSAAAKLRADGAITISKNARIKSGLSYVNLGEKEYRRRLYRLHYPEVLRGITGLSRKKLGNAEYQRQLWRLRNPTPSNRGASGIDWKKLGRTAGMRLWRELKRKNLTNVSQLAKSIS